MYYCAVITSAYQASGELIRHTATTEYFVGERSMNCSINKYLLFVFTCTGKTACAAKFVGQQTVGGSCLLIIMHFGSMCCMLEGNGNSLFLTYVVIVTSCAINR